jgi:hypothetical protein
MSKVIQPQLPTPPIPQPHAGPQRSLSLDVREASLVPSSCSTPSSFDGCQPHSEEYPFQPSTSLPNIPTTATVNVKFAPLPKIEPRDVKSIRPLGVAARSRMLQQRREMRMQSGQRHPGTWSELDDRHMDFVPDELQEEDSLEVLGRYICAKSKSLWRRVSSKGKQPGKEGTGGDASEGPTDGEERKPLVQQSRGPNRERPSSSPEPPDEARESCKNKTDSTARMSSQDLS